MMRNIIVISGLVILGFLCSCEDKPTGEDGHGFSIDTLYVVDDARVESSRPYTTLGLSGDLTVGQIDYAPGLTYKFNSLIKLPPLTDSIIPEQIFFARLVLHYQGGVASLPDEISAYEIIEDWAEATVTWSNQPAIATPAFETDTIANYQLEINVYEFYNDTLPHYGVMLTSDGVEKYFTGSENAGSGARPMVIIKQRLP